MDANGTVDGIYFTEDASFTTTFPMVTNQSDNLPPMCCNANCSYNKQDDCDSLLETFLLSNLMRMNNYIMIRVILTWILFFISFTGNLIALWSVVKSYLSSFNTRGLPNAQVMMLHMTLADMAYTLCILPLDAVWNSTGQWYAGNAMCKILMFLKHFAMYSSSGMITVMALERMTCILTQPTQSQQRRRLIAFIVAVWTFAFLNAIPALVFFGIYPLYLCEDMCSDVVNQCVDFVLFTDDISGLRGYYIYTMMISFFIPLLSIIICHSMIAVEITRMAVRDKALMGRRKSVTTNEINKARRKSLLMTLFITTSFLVCWAPYYVKGLYDWGAKTRTVQADGMIWMYLSMYLNPCLHPIIFACFMKSVRDQFTTVCHVLSCRKSSKSVYDSSMRNSANGRAVTTSFNGHQREASSPGQTVTSPSSEAKKSLLSDPRKISFKDDEP